MVWTTTSDNCYMEDDLWKNNAKVSSYFKGTWWPVKDKWVPCLLKKPFLNSLNTNNGIKVQNRILKQSYLN